MCSAVRGAVRNAKQKKAVPAKNSEANFWRPRFTRPLRAGKRANANFACSEGFFLSGAPRHMAGWPFLRGQPLLCGLLCPVPRRFFPAAALAAVREACCNRVRLLRRCFPAHTPPAAFAPGLRCPPGACLSFVRCAQKAQVFLLLFHAQPTESSSFFCRCSAALFPARGSCHLLLFRGLLRPLPVCLFCVVYASSLLFFCPFLPNFFLSNLFSLVAQAATGLYFLPKRK